jgi:hypothetical protein
MMHHSPIMKIIMMVSWLLTSLVSINMLTGMYDYNFIIWIGNRMPGLIIPLCWIIGLAGFFSLAMWVKAVMMCSSGEGCKPCGCVGPCNCR